MLTAIERLFNPVWNVLYKVTGKNYALTKEAKVADANSGFYREVVMDYVRKRKSG